MFLVVVCRDHGEFTNFKKRQQISKSDRCFRKATAVFKKRQLFSKSDNGIRKATTGFKKRQRDFKTRQQDSKCDNGIQNATNSIQKATNQFCGNLISPERYSPKLEISASPLNVIPMMRPKARQYASVQVMQKPYFEIYYTLIKTQF